MDDQSVDPYAPPKAPLEILPSLENAACWRRGATVVLSSGGRLPDRCVICNEPAEPPVGRAGSGAFALKWKAIVAPRFCRGHLQRREQWGSLIRLCLLLTLLGTGVDSFVIKVFGAALLALALMMKRVMSPSFKATRVDDQTIELNGYGAAFLASLPTEPPPSAEAAI